MRRNKKGEMSVELIIKVALGLLVILILVFASYRYIAVPLSKTTNCPDQGGTCVDSLAGCSEGSDVQYQLRCEGSQKCCLPRELKADETARFTTTQRQALANPIFLTQGSNPNPISELNLKEGESTAITVSFNQKLSEEAFGPVAYYLTNSLDAGAIYVFEGNSIKSITQTSGFSQESTNRAGVTEIVTTLMQEIPFEEPKQSSKRTFNYKPSLKDTYNKYTLQVIVLDKKKLYCNDLIKDNDAWIKCLSEDPQIDLDSKASSTLDSLGNTAWTDRSYWLAGKTYPVKIQRILDITGVSTQWGAEDTITLTASDPAYSKNIAIGLVNGYEFETTDQVLDACVSETGIHFVQDVTNIIGTTLETTGLPLNINIGGFRLPTGKTELRYITQKVRIAMANGKANVKIDKATMIEDFYKSGLADPNNVGLFSGQNTFICAKASDDSGTAHAVSTTPLKVDVIPPYVDENSVRIVYPDLVFNTPLTRTQYPSMAGQNYFYTQYPRVIVSCQDYGQSGCTNYDYYLKTDNFINVRVASDDIKDGITGIALQVGLNELFEYFVSKDPLDTFCPPVFSTSEYRRNTNNVIPLRVRGQGMICIRVADKAGNAAVVWKEIWNPQELVDRVAAEATEEVVEAINN